MQSFSQNGFSYAYLDALELEVELLILAVAPAGRTGGGGGTVVGGGGSEGGGSVGGAS